MFLRIDDMVISGHQLSTQSLRGGVDRQGIGGRKVTPDHLGEFDIWSTCGRHMVDIWSTGRYWSTINQEMTGG
jgi:hypothetical protein